MGFVLELCQHRFYFFLERMSAENDFRNCELYQCPGQSQTSLMEENYLIVCLWSPKPEKFLRSHFLDGSQ